MEPLVFQIERVGIWSKGEGLFRRLVSWLTLDHRDGRIYTENPVLQNQFCQNGGRLHTKIGAQAPLNPTLNCGKERVSVWMGIPSFFSG